MVFSSDVRFCQYAVSFISLEGESGKYSSVILRRELVGTMYSPSVFVTTDKDFAFAICNKTSVSEATVPSGLNIFPSNGF